MSSGKTTYYSLNQWAPTDPVLRTEFNKDNELIANALRSLSTTVSGLYRITYGKYTGNGSASRSISVSSGLKAVYICRPDGTTRVPPGSNTYQLQKQWGGLALSGSNLYLSYYPDYPVITISGSSFTVYYTDAVGGANNYNQVLSNENGQLFHYFAIY